METEDKAEKKVSLPIKRKTLDGLLVLTSIVAGIDFVITPFISQWFTGEYKPLHEYLGLPPHMSELAVKAGGIYWGLTALYIGYFRDKYLGRQY